MMVALGAINMKLQVEKGGNINDKSLVSDVGVLAAFSVAFKNPAWRDEHEVRLQHLVDVEKKGEILRLADKGGVSAGRNVRGQAIQFASRSGTVTPHFDQPFELSAKRQPIGEIVLGPKCPNAYGNIRLLLGNYGYIGVELDSAGSAYR